MISSWLSNTICSIKFVIYLLPCTASAILCTFFSFQGAELDKRLASVSIPKLVLYVLVFMLIIKLK